ncbi:GDP-mannose 4,6-dehydratase, partial [Poseidonibacter ostreae]
HVVDLALGHVKALQKMNSIDDVLTVNLGTGNGYSVIDMINAFQKASGKKVPYNIVDRRPGDIAKCFADPSYAKEVLDWEATRGVDEMCEDSWRWQSNNPDGF